MNFVSILVYLADVLGTLDLILNTGVVLALVPIGFSFFMWTSQDNGVAARDD